MVRCSQRILVLCAIALALPAAVQAAPRCPKPGKVRIEGTVLAAGTGAPIPHAIIVMTTDQPLVRGADTSDDGGRFAIDRTGNSESFEVCGLKRRATVTLEVRGVGYLAASQEVVTGRAITAVEVELAPDPEAPPPREPPEHPSLKRP